MDLSKTESVIALLICLAVFIAAGFYYVGEAQKCADKGGRYMIGNKYELPACVKEVK